MAEKDRMGDDPLAWLAEEKAAEEKAADETASTAVNRNTGSRKTSASVRSAGLKMDSKKNDADWVEESFTALVSQGESIVADFYAHLFRYYPELKPLFAGIAPAAQQKKLLAALMLLVQSLRKPAVLVDYLKGLGARHQNYGVLPEDYDKVASSLLAVLKKHAAELWSSDVELAWSNTLLQVKEIMLGAYIPEETDEMAVQNNQELVRMRSAVDGAMTAIMMVDRDFNITYANQATIAMLSAHEVIFSGIYPGFSVEQLIGSNIDTFHKNPAHQRKLLSDPNNLPYSTDISVGPLRFRLNVTAMVDADGKYIGNTLEWSDVTEVRRKELEVARLASAIQGAMTSIMMIDRDFVITYVNDATTTMLRPYQDTLQKVFPGFDVDKLVGTNIDIFHKNPAHQRQLLSNPNNLPYSTDIAVGPLKFRLNVTATMDNNGNYIGNALEWANVTEVRQKELEVARLTGAINGAMTSIMMIDRDFTITYVNDATVKMLRPHQGVLQGVFPGFNVDRLVGANIDGFHKNPAHQRQMLSNPANLPYSTEIKVGPLEFRLNVTATMDAEGNYIGNTLEWSDITEQRKLERTVQRVLDSTSVVMKAMAEGDLSKQMEGEYEGDFAELQAAINETVNSMSDVVQDITDAAVSVSSGASEISRGNIDLSQRTEEQASSLQQTASSMEELTNTVKHNSDNAREANQLAASAREKAEQGGEVIQKAIAAMAAISASSKKVADIIGVIDEIAFQTNLLALNAAVEAARAGEQGRGFAVVASEVRNLAQRSAGAAKEIKALINDSGEKVTEGASLVNESGRTLQEIVIGFKKVGDIVSEIAVASIEQTSGIEQVNKAVSQMDEMTQQNAALVEQAAAASESLDEQGKNLQRRMAFFNTGTEVLSPAQVRQAAREQRTHHSSQRAAGAKRQLPMAKQAASEEWDEF